jgi:hypothetical protein
MNMELNDLTKNFIDQIFSSEADLNTKISEFSKAIKCLFAKRDSRTNKNLATSSTFPRKSIHFVCVHAGSHRERITDGSRPNQKTQSLGCSVHFNVRLEEEPDGRTVMKIHAYEMVHNHPLSSASFNQYSSNRALTDEERSFVIPMLKVRIIYSYNHRQFT